ncbi:hypothetical protein TNCV_948491 [Trichonephila clavipes]|nr:hypothetical protein TNCV_948491 [Trichonephila clavipes]
MNIPHNPAATKNKIGSSALGFQNRKNMFVAILIILAEKKTGILPTRFTNHPAESDTIPQIAPENIATIGT